MTPSSPVLFFPFIAMPNGGKGTQTKLLSERFNMPRLDMGALLRVIAKEESELGRRVQERLAQGQLVSIDIVLDVLQDGIEKELSARPDNGEPVGFILDGFPRNAEQSEALMTLSKRMEARIARAFYLEVPVAVVKERAESRRVCGNCGAIYNLLSKPPKQPDVCDVCGASPLQHRIDDQPEQVANRLQSFQDETNPVLDYFDKLGVLCRVDGNREIQVIHAELAQLTQQAMDSLVRQNV